MLVTGSFVTVELLLRALSDSGDFSDDLSGEFN
jgi:hypothetical protein